MRLGWDHASLNAPELARLAEAAGVQLLTVHARTRCQFFKGEADWAPGAQRQGRGAHSRRRQRRHCRSRHRARAALEASGADAVMVGRGAYGAPWMPGRIAATPGDRQRSGRRRRSPSKARSPRRTSRPCWSRTARCTDCATHASTSAGIWRRSGRPAGSGQGLAAPAVHLGKCPRRPGRPGDVLRRKRGRPHERRTRARARESEPAPAYRARSAARRRCRIPSSCWATTTACSTPTPPRKSFFSLSQGVLKRQTLPDIIAFSSPLSALVGQVRRTGATVNEYGIDVGLPRSGVQKLVDVFAGAMPDHPGLIVLMLQQRSMAQMIERQLTHRAAARSVSGLAAGAGARDQEPAVGHPRRGPAAGARPQGRRPGADPAHLHGDRPHPQSGRPHGGVRRRAARRRRSR